MQGHSLDGKRIAVSELLSKIGLLWGSSVTAIGWLASVDWIALIGLVVLVASTAIKFEFNRRQDLRAQERHSLEMKELRSRISDHE